MVRAKILVLLLFFAVFWSHGQNQWGIEGKLRSGFLAPHRAIMAHLPDERVVSSEISYFVVKEDTNSWANFYAKPRIGITAFFTQTGNTEILGHAFGAFVFGELPFFRANCFSVNTRVGTGAAYVTKVYDKTSNPKNNAISSRINGAIVLGLNIRYEKKRNSFAFGAELSHISNGSAKLPNLGLNYPFLSLSYGRVVGNLKKANSLFRPQKNALPWQIGINGIFSWKEVFPISGKKYPIYAVNAFARKIVSPKLGFEVALDGIYKTTIKDYIPEFEKRPSDQIQAGVFAGYVLSFDRLTTVVGMGGYIRDKYLPEDRFYHRLGIRYQFKTNLQLGWTLKANWGKADYWEWSVGYVFNRKKK